MGFKTVPPGVDLLISDFDGTITRHDFYQMAIEHLIPADCPDYWIDYRQGRLTHFEALRGYFSEIRASEAEVLEVVARMEIDPGLARAVHAMREAGWQIVVASAGCKWYIQHLLRNAGVELEVYANPGEFNAGGGLQMRLPNDSPFVSQELGVDKAGIVRHAIQQGHKVAFAGDGLPDIEAARLVPAEYRFARGDLAESLARERQGYQPFRVWSDIATKLIG